MLIDTHCHLANKRLFPNIEQVINEAKNMGVPTIICAAATVEESQTAQDIAQKFDNIFCHAGLHPHDANDLNEQSLNEISALIDYEKCVALGEIGLDYHYDYSPRKIQQEAFATQLELAKQKNIPVVIHTREAFEDTIAIIRESQFSTDNLLFHSFTGNPDQAKICLDLGATMSFSGISTFKTAPEIRESAKLCPADKIVVETDAPYLSPVPVRKIKVNTPGNVKYTAQLLASERNQTFEEFSKFTTENAKRFFKLPL